jgi:hypothetical protein
MNNKSCKLIRKQAGEIHKVPEFVLDQNGVKRRNPKWKKLINIVKKEYLSLPHNERAEFKESGI